MQPRTVDSQILLAVQKHKRLLQQGGYWQHMQWQLPSRRHQHLVVTTIVFKHLHLATVHTHATTLLQAPLRTTHRFSVADALYLMSEASITESKPKQASAVVSGTNSVQCSAVQCSKNQSYRCPVQALPSCQHCV
jgi:hypothetical protein